MGILTSFRYLASSYPCCPCNFIVFLYCPFGILKCFIYTIAFGICTSNYCLLDHLHYNDTIDLVFLTSLHEDNCVLSYLTTLCCYAYINGLVRLLSHSGNSKSTHVIINVMFHNKNFTFSLLLFNFDSTAIR